jgi:hypothetical protein
MGAGGPGNRGKPGYPVPDTLRLKVPSDDGELGEMVVAEVVRLLEGPRELDENGIPWLT